MIAIAIAITTVEVNEVEGTTGEDRAAITAHGEAEEEEAVMVAVATPMDLRVEVEYLHRLVVVAAMVVVDGMNDVVGKVFPASPC